ncbi:GGDEF domain-containing protein [Chitinilyticum litopenaei]|uniref:GGDEF domain-containing protein n=1 Tax=Chitinilyticum litopenaei TaxID=1121276 RepID=UPI00040B9DEF|nr:GGDEF domain-containing protein [Chitinilyticum litopenaei]
MSTPTRSLHELSFFFQLHDQLDRDPAAARDEAEAQLHTRKDRFERIALQLLQGIAMARCGDYVQAEHLLEFALRRAKLRGFGQLIAEAKDELAGIYLMRGLTDEALKQWLDCFEAALHENSRYGLVRSHLGIGKVFYALEKYDEAKAQHLRSMELSYTLSDSTLSTTIHICLAADYLRLADFNSAFVALAIAEDSLGSSRNMLHWRAELLAYRGQALAGMGNWDDALRCLVDARTISTEHHFQWSAALADLEIGRIHFVLGQEQQAEGHLLQAREIARQIRCVLFEIQCEELLYSIRKQCSDYVSALQHHRRYTELTLGFIDTQRDHQIDPTTRRRMRRMENALALAQSEEENNSLLARLQVHEEHIQALKIEAETDPLTGIYNRRALEERLQRELYLAQQAHRPFSLLMLDIDHFKQVNDRFSHLVGDTVLKTVAEIMQACCRADEFITRYGGEEFVILLPGATAETARHIAERIRLKISHHDWFSVHPELFQLTISIGSAALRDVETGRELIARADHYLYQAKADGRNCTRGDT